MLLAVDTSTRMIGLALYDGAQVLAEMSWLSKNHHTIELAPAVQQALTQVGAAGADLQVLAAAIGPGSFTGLRIGLALVKGLALSHRIPLVGIPTMEILAAAHPQENCRLATVLEAGRKRLAIGWFRFQDGHWQPDGALENLLLTEFTEGLSEPTLVCGELNATVRKHLAEIKEVRLVSPAMSARRPGILAELAWQRWQKGEVDHPATLKPIYLHYGEPIPE